MYKMENDYEVPVKKARTKPKVVKDWEEDDIFKLIGLVETQTCLWNTADEGYHNKMLRDNAWREIGENFYSRYDTADLIAKWTNLRIQYRGYAGKAKTKTGQNAVDPPKWRFFNSMNFLGRAEEPQSQPTVANEVSNTDSDSNSQDNSNFSIQRRRKLPNVQSATTKIAESMREVVAVMKERSQNTFEPNIAFSNYLLSELNTLSNDAAASVRRRVAFFFLQCLEEERENQF